MAKSITKASKFSQEMFEKYKLAICVATNSDEVINTEFSDNRVLNLMDKYSGIDGISVNDKSICGIASRFQIGINYESFTIRVSRESGVKTELEKRKNEIANGYFYPLWTLQGYVDKEGKLLSLAFIKTKKLYEAIEMHPELTELRHTGCDEIGQAAFYAVYWEELKNKGIEFIKTIILDGSILGFSFYNKSVGDKYCNKRIVLNRPIF